MEDRFTGPELREALAAAGLCLQQARELKRLGILGIARKEG
jgi:hypothetical protein